MNWKEQLRETHNKSEEPYLFADDYKHIKEQDDASIKVWEQFISSEIIERIIEDIDSVSVLGKQYIDDRDKGTEVVRDLISKNFLKQYLKDKWLSQRSEQAQTHETQV